MQGSSKDALGMGRGAGVALGDQLLEGLETVGQHRSDHTFLLRWLRDGPWGEAAQHVVWQFLIFYAITLIGFGFLYLMIRSTSSMRQRLRELRKEVAETLRAQQASRFDLENYNSMAFGVA